MPLALLTCPMSHTNTSSSITFLISVPSLRFCSDAGERGRVICHSPITSCLIQALVLCCISCDSCSLPIELIPATESRLNESICRSRAAWKVYSAGQKDRMAVKPCSISAAKHRYSSQASKRRYAFCTRAAAAGFGRKTQGSNANLFRSIVGLLGALIETFHPGQVP